ncbi:beta-glucosidase BglX [Rhodohalobacter sp. SW132]|uniref:beta-glucosidase BglX n=1 Tax=Rhodohalobacter sp. SW132 TaxID=2293433 RepID=UPI000E27DEFD|nr:beta-glucosidase BglX [Rhodohalobacter sp. SW132]REL38982.1 beta-glucosidase BglX [Rhodohalobacter sp. SW132]
MELRNLPGLLLFSVLILGSTLLSTSEKPVGYEVYEGKEQITTNTPVRITPLRHPEKVDSVLALMTLEEKVGQLNLLSSGFAETGPTLSEEYREMIGEAKLGGVFNAHTVEHTLDLQRIAVEETRLGIPLLFAFDVIHGHRTIFPVPLAEASTWDPDLIKKASRIAAKESAAAGLHWTFTPMLDVSPDPRWGRIVESSGEDPLLNKRFGVARIEGFQGDDLYELDTIMATAKHFAAYGAAEAGRDYNTVDISERTLREIHLPAFKAAVDADVRTFMTAFNEYDGVPATGSDYLFNKILRDDWGFDGFVITDYTAIMEMIPHGYARDEAHAGELALNANVDMDMMSNIFLNELPGLVESGRVSEEQVDMAVSRILDMKFELGLFDDPYRYSDYDREAETIMRQDFLDFALEVAEKSIVLLKNENNLLPLSDSAKNIAIIGPLGDNQYDVMGSWSAAGESSDNVSLLAGLRNAVPEGTNIQFSEGVPLSLDDHSADGIDEAVNLAAESDVVILALGEGRHMSGEAASRTTLNLPGAQQDLLEAVHATGTPVVMVLMAGRPLDINWANENVGAIVNAFYLGTRTGDAIASVLYGNHNPSGKLTFSWPYTVGQIPNVYYQKKTGRPIDPDQRYTSKFIDAPNDPLFPFGYGLSYTSFDYSNLTLSETEISRDGHLTISVDVTNSGDFAGHEIVQLYTRKMVASVTQPVRLLRDFEKIFLEPGETKTVEFTLNASQLTYLDQQLNPVLEPGIVKVFVGPNVSETMENELEIIQ